MDQCEQCSTIKERLECCNFDGIDQLVKKYFDCKDLSGRLKASFAAVFFQGTVKALQTEHYQRLIECADSCQALIDAVLRCCDVYRNHKKEVVSADPLLGEKFTYHILKRIAVEQVKVSSILQLSECLHCLLRESSSSDAKMYASITSNTHNILWKLAANLESLGKDGDFANAARLRIQALSFYALDTAKACDDLCNRAVMALTRFDQLAPASLSLDRAQLADLYCEAILQKICGTENPVHALAAALPLVRLLFGVQEWSKLEKVVDLLCSASRKARVTQVFCEMLQRMKTVAQCISNDRTVQQPKCKDALQEIDDSQLDVGDFGVEDWRVLRELSAVGMKHLFQVLPSTLEDQFQYSPAVQLQMVTLALQAFTCHRLYHKALGPSSKDCSQMTSSERHHACCILLHLLYRVYRAACSPEADSLSTAMADRLQKEELPETVLEFYLDKVERIESLSLKLHEIYYCGYMAVKLVGCLQSKWGNARCQGLFKMATQLLTQYCYADIGTAADKVKQVHLWNVYRDAVGACEDCSKARSLAAAYCSLQPQPFHCGLVVKAWVHLKHSVFEAKGSKAATMFMADAAPKGKKMLLLGMELEMLQNLNFKCCMPHPAARDDNKATDSDKATVQESRGYVLEWEILHEMTRVMSTPTEKTKTWLRHVELGWKCDPFKTEALGKYLSLADQETVEERDDDAMLVQGQLCVWRYLVEHMELSQKTRDSGVEEMFDAQPRSQEPQPCHVHRDHEVWAVSLMEKALKAWKGRMVPCSTDSVEMSRVQLLLPTCITFCKLAGKCHLAGQFLQLLQELCARDGVEVIAKQLGMAAASVLSDENSSSLFSTFANTTQGVIARAKARIRQGLIQEAYDELLSGTEGLGEKKTRTNIFILGIARRLASFCLEHRAEVHGEEDDALKAAHQAVRYHAGVMTSLWEEPWEDKWIPGAEMAYKLAGVGEMMESYLQLARLYRQVGEARWARCFLKEGFKVAHSFVLPQWCSLFCLEMTRMLALMHCPSPGLLLWQWAAKALSLENTTLLQDSRGKEDTDSSPEICRTNNTVAQETPMLKGRQGRQQGTGTKTAKGGKSAKSKTASSEKELERRQAVAQDPLMNSSERPSPPCQKPQGWQTYIEMEQPQCPCQVCLGSASLLSLALLSGLAWAELAAVQNDALHALEVLHQLGDALLNLRSPQCDQAKTSPLPSAELDTLLLEVLCLRVATLAKLGDFDKALALAEKYETLPPTAWTRTQTLTFQLAKLKSCRLELGLAVAMKKSFRDGRRLFTSYTKHKDEFASQDDSSGLDLNSTSESKTVEEPEDSSPPISDKVSIEPKTTGRKRGGRGRAKKADTENLENEIAKDLASPPTSKPGRQTKGKSQRGRKKVLQPIQIIAEEGDDDQQNDLSDSADPFTEDDVRTQDAASDDVRPSSSTGSAMSSPGSIIGPSPPPVLPVFKSCGRGRKPRGKSGRQEIAMATADPVAEGSGECHACSAESSVKTVKGRGRQRQPTAGTLPHTCCRGDKQQSEQGDAGSGNTDKLSPVDEEHSTEQEVLRHPDVFEFDEADTEDTKPTKKTAKSRKPRAGKASSGTGRSARQPRAKKPEVARSTSLMLPFHTPPTTPLYDCREPESILSASLPASPSSPSSPDSGGSPSLPCPGQRLLAPKSREEEEDCASLEPGASSGEEEAIEIPRIVHDDDASQDLDFHFNDQEDVVSKEKDYSCDSISARGNRELRLGPQEREVLEEVWERVRHFPPSLLYRQTCRLLALSHLQAGHAAEAAFFLAESAAVTLRHRHLFQINRRTRRVTEKHRPKGSKETDAGRKGRGGGRAAETPRPQGREDRGGEGETLDHLTRVRSQLLFNKVPADLPSFLSAIPDEWTVCQISVVSLPAGAFHQMLLTIFDKMPLTVTLPAFDDQMGCDILKEFNSHQEQNLASLQLTDCKTWHCTRRMMDKRLMTLLEDMQWEWLGPYRALLQGFPGNLQPLKQAASSIQKALSKAGGREVPPCTVMRLLMLAASLSQAQGSADSLEKCVVEILRLTGPEAGSVAARVADLLLQNCKGLSRSAPDLPVVLILDERVQHLPWESIPGLRDSQVTRMPSLYFLHHLLQQQCLASSALTSDPAASFCVARPLERVFYVLDPEKNLPDTHKTFLSQFQQQKGWEGIVQEPPSKMAFSQALSNYDLFIYCGHGTGCKFYHSDDIQNTQCRAISLLIGCSSARLEVKGQLEAAGVALSYCLGECPLVLGMLWDVTDKDIDRFLKELLRSWQAAEPGTPLLSLLPKARNACNLPFLIGAAPVVYGLPIAKLAS